ncbi:hypothetical protein AB0K09_00565 [Streptomyces sp. NPDC049577]|uniref:hypothetical protein n=1 Tax=Streptomyces sp. NPDC049577 TaxID=3155153 RepID=UPI00343A19E4
MTPAARRVTPDAVAGVIASVVRDNRGAPPEVIGRLAVQELRSLGWHISPVPVFTDDELDGLSDEELAELFPDPPEPVSLAGYARPATRAPAEIGPYRHLVELPPIDTYEPATHDAPGGSL